MARPDWSKSPGERQKDALAREAQARKLARVRARMEQAANERTRKASAHLN